MICRDFEYLALLLHSGEISDDDRTALDRHLRACTNCAAFAADLDRLLATAHQTLPRGEPSDLCLTRIRAEAKALLQSNQLSTPTPIRARSHSHSYALALAAGLALLLVSLFVLHRFGSSTPDGASTKPSQTPTPSAYLPHPRDLKPSMDMEWFTDAGAFHLFFLDDCFAVEEASELVRQGHVTPPELDLMILEGLAI